MLKIRNANKNDVPYITSTWLRSFRDSPVVNMVPNSLYFRYHHKLLEELIFRCSEKGGMLIACEWEDTVDGRGELGEQGQKILGYLCAEPLEFGPMLHYVYIRAHLRNQGIATKLLDAFYDDHHYTTDDHSLVYTHHGKCMSNYEFRKKMQGRYDPVHHLYFLFTSMKDGWEAQ